MRMSAKDESGDFMQNSIQNNSNSLDIDITQLFYERIGY